MKKRVFTTHTLKEFLATAVQIAKQQKTNTRLITLRGPLGAGKTTFVQAFGKAIGIRSTISSPTFALIQEYEVRKRKLSVAHIDLYRIKKQSELNPLHIQDYLADPRIIVIVEWADRFPRLWKASPRTDVHITLNKNGSRNVIVKET